ncbi:MAG: phosphoglucosamine mutase [Pseudomonadota bacterium]
MGQFFGTDGIRGPVGVFPLTPEGISRIAQSAARWMMARPVPAGHPRHLVVIGSDPRAASDWIVPILSGTFSAHGIDVFPLGRFATTPEVACETKASGATLGLAVTASHNPYTDHGMKFFAADGFKLCGPDQDAIEAGLGVPSEAIAAPAGTGHINTVRHTPVYDRQVRASLPARLDLRGMGLVFDAANGAAQARLANRLGKSGPWQDLLDPPIIIGAGADGVNINDGFGATHPEALAAKVVETGAFAGVALDGDADRLIMVDETGETVDGDQLLALLATAMQAEGRLRGGGIVATVMSNLGLERHLGGLSLSMVRAKVGDRNVVEAMRAGGFNLGGEQSGHLVLLDAATTGDGLLAALHVLSIAKADGRKFSEISRVFEPVPQKLVNVRYGGEDPLADAGVQSNIARITGDLGDNGRVLVRKSGTEPLIRIMVEAFDEAELEDAISAIEGAVRGAA